MGFLMIYSWNSLSFFRFTFDIYAYSTESRQEAKWEREGGRGGGIGKDHKTQTHPKRNHAVCQKAAHEAIDYDCAY